MFTEIAQRVPRGLRRLPDGETGERSNWIVYQLPKFAECPQLVPSAANEDMDYSAMPRFELSDNATAEDIAWPGLGYAAAYRGSYEVFRSLRSSGVLPSDVRFQVQYPTPLASVASWTIPEQHVIIEESYRRALFADLDELLDSVPHESIAVQWDVAIEFGILEKCFPSDPSLDFDSIVDRIARCIARVPPDVPVGLHLCYGDLGHKHFAEPDSLELQVRMVNELLRRSRRVINWVSFTVPQDRDDQRYFAPLSGILTTAKTELAFGIVPYRPDDQLDGTIERQVAAIDAMLGAQTTWAVSTECGLGRSGRDEVLRLLDLHRDILEMSTRDSIGGGGTEDGVF